MADASTSALVIQGLVTMATGGTGAAVVTALISRRKTRVEAEKTQAETGLTHAEVVGTGASTAATQVDTAMDLVREMRVDMTSLRHDLDEEKAWRRRHEIRLDAHVRWDEIVWSEFQRRGIQIEPPPLLRDP